MKKLVNSADLYLKILIAEKVFAWIIGIISVIGTIYYSDKLFAELQSLMMRFW